MALHLSPRIFFVGSVGVLRAKHPRKTTTIEDVKPPIPSGKPTPLAGFRVQITVTSCTLGFKGKSRRCHKTWLENPPSRVGICQLQPLPFPAPCLMLPPVQSLVRANRQATCCLQGRPSALTIRSGGFGQVNGALFWTSHSHSVQT